MIDRLETTLKKYNDLEQELTRPEVLSDVKKTREYSKEMASLADIVNCYKKYKKTYSDFMGFSFINFIHSFFSSNKVGSIFI